MKYQYFIPITNEEEIWKDVVSYEGLYKVSSFGRLKSFFNSELGFIKSPVKDCRGYVYCNLCTKNKRKNIKLHRLVAMAFISNPDQKLTVNHIDGNKENNFYKNLEWMSGQEQMDHAAKIGLFNNHGERSKTRKLRKEDIINMRKIYKNGGITIKDVSSLFKVGKSETRRIIRGEAWSSVTEESPVEGMKYKQRNKKNE